MVEIKFEAILDFSILAKMVWRLVFFFWSCFFKADTICTHYKSCSPFLQGKVQIICSLPVILIFTWLKFSYSFAKAMMLNESNISPASFC